MSTHVGLRNHSSGSAGTVTLVLGILFSAAVALTYVLSLSEGVNPPTWIRALGLMWLPIGLVGVPIAYSIARRGDGRTRGTVGVMIALLGLLALIALVVALG